MRSDPEARSATPIRLRVGLHADLRRFLPKGAAILELEIADRSTVADLLGHLGIPDVETVTVGVNGELAQRTTELHDQDEVTMFSPMEGG